MVRIRLRRVGGRNQPSYRIVAAEKESPAKGRFIEILGLYNPRTEPATIELKEDRIYHWISNGAQPSESAMQVFKVAGLTERFERFKTGEAVEKLVAEAEAAAKTRNADRKTRRDAPLESSANRKTVAKAAAAATAAAQATPAAAAPAAEAPAAEEAPAPEAPEAEAAAPAEETPAAE